MSPPVEVILFDLGGVLIELGESPIPPEWLPNTSKFLLSDWFSSATAISFEKGLISAQEFVNIFQTELNVDASHESILKHFTEWPIGLFPGTSDLLASLGQQYRLAILSNTNELHWPRIIDEFKIDRHFNDVFASFQINMAKPELGIFRHVISELKTEPEKILFFDDNISNIEASKRLGINGHHVKGIQQVRQVLSNMDIICG